MKSVLAVAFFFGSTAAVGLMGSIVTLINYVPASTPQSLRTAVILLPPLVVLFFAALPACQLFGEYSRVFKWTWIVPLVRLTSYLLRGRDPGFLVGVGSGDEGLYRVALTGPLCAAIGYSLGAYAWWRFSSLRGGRLVNRHILTARRLPDSVLERRDGTSFDSLTGNQQELFSRTRATGLHQQMKTLSSILLLLLCTPVIGLLADAALFSSNQPLSMPQPLRSLLTMFGPVACLFFVSIPACRLFGEYSRLFRWAWVAPLIWVVWYLFGRPNLSLGYLFDGAQTWFLYTAPLCGAIGYSLGAHVYWKDPSLHQVSRGDAAPAALGQRDDA